MKKFLLASTILLSAANALHAADMPTKAVPQYVTPLAWSWSGFYIGGTVGYGWGNFDNAASAYDVSVPLGTNGSGVVAGLYGGYNFMWDKLLIGIETDFAWANIRGGADFNGHLDANHGSIPWAAQANNRIGWLGTTRGRLGWAFGPVLVYGTGGVAYGKVETDGVGVLGASSINANFATPFSGSSTRTGWTAGAGVEYAVTKNLLARVEYLYYDLGTADWLVPNTPVKVTTDANGNIVRAGLGWKF